MATTTENLTLKFELLSAATFGRGDGLAGLVDSEVEHDRYGLPFLRGRTLRGLLAEEMEGFVHALNLSKVEKWEKARNRLLGVEGKFTDETGIMRVGDACLPGALRRLLMASVKLKPEDKDRQILPAEMLAALTTIRRQTAMSERGAPEAASLRSMRAVLRGTVFEATLTFDEELSPTDKALLTAAVLAWRRAGTGRNRGRGRLRAWLESEAWMREQFESLQKEVAQ